MKREGDIVFINRRMSRGGNMGSVPQLWLKMHRYQGGEEGAKGLVTSFFHLPDLEGERKGVKPGAGQERKSPSQAPCPCPHRLTWRVAPAPPYSPVSPDPTLLPTTAPQRQRAQRQPAQRSAVQPSRWWCPEARAAALPQLGSAAVAVAAVAPGGAASASDLGCHPRGRGVRWGAQQLGARARRGSDTCDTVQRDGGGGNGLSYGQRGQRDSGY